MARLRTHNRRRFARQLGPEAAAWRLRVSKEGPWFRYLLRLADQASPSMAVLFRDLYRRGYPAALMRKDLEQIAADLQARSVSV